MYVYMSVHMYSAGHWRPQKNNLAQKLKASYIYATRVQVR